MIIHFFVCPLTTLTNGDIQVLREYGDWYSNIEHRECKSYIYLKIDNSYTNEWNRTYYFMGAYLE